MAKKDIIKEAVFQGALAYETDKVQGIVRVHLGSLECKEDSIFEILRPFLDVGTIELSIKAVDKWR